MSTPASLPAELVEKIAAYEHTFTLIDPISRDLLAQMASAQLRLERVAQLENLALQNEPTLDQLALLSKLERYRKSAEASYHRAFRILCQRQASEQAIEFPREIGAAAPAAALTPFLKPNTSPPAQQPYIRPEPKIGRNEPCPCQSGRKYKVCCLNSKAIAA